MVTLSITRSLLFGIGSLLALSGCSLPISAELRREANRDLNFMGVADNPSAYAGNTVIWGGIIRQVRSTSDGTEIQIAQSPLKRDDSPDIDSAGGEFIAITGEMLNLNTLKKGERITLGGEIVGERTENIKAVKFKYPVIYLKEFHLWDRGNKWWEPSSSSRWFWELFGTSQQSLSGDWGRGSREQKVW